MPTRQKLAIYEGHSFFDALQTINVAGLGKISRTATCTGGLPRTQIVRGAMRCSMIKGFFKVQREWLLSGAFSGWTKGELLVFLVLKMHENTQTHECYPSYAKIRAMTGLSYSSIRDGVNSLIEHRVIVNQSGHSKREANRYLILEPWR